MTVFHYGGSWFYVDEPKPADDKNSFELSVAEWQLIQSLDVPSAKTVMMVKQKTKGNIRGQ